MTNQEVKKQSFGEQRPRSLNTDIVEEGDELYNEEYNYLNVYVKQKVVEEEEYLVVDEQLWTFLYKIYGGKEVKRRLLHPYGNYVPEVDLNLIYLWTLDTNTLQALL